MEIINRFIRYAKIDTQSDDYSNTIPSTTKQLDLINLLVKELKEFGLEVLLDEYSRIYAHANGNPNYPTIALSAHVDTAPDFSGKNVNPILIENYNGKTIRLGKSSLYLTPDEFPVLNRLKGKTLLTTDGTTLLGADDKAGIAIIMEFIKEYLKMDENARHPLAIIFTPDEEIGNGADYFDNNKLKAKYGYTLDGGSPYHLSYENFNAYSLRLKIKGKSIHPGSAKGTMINAIYVFSTFLLKLDPKKVPWLTEDKQGFNHVNEINGDVTDLEASFIIRNHDLDLLKSQIHEFEEVKKECEKLYPGVEITFDIKEQYLNMYEIIKDNFEVVDKISNAYKSLNIPLKFTPTRGGTDGARFSFLGCPCPNLGTGSYNHHGPYEFLVKEEMLLLVDILKKVFQTDNFNK